MTTRKTIHIAGGLIILFILIQFVPAGAADNPPVEEEVRAPEEVMTVLRRSCYDCHSHETVWPWYAHVAPAKWLVRKDVADAREDLNFSAWNRYDAERRAHKWEEVAEEVEEGEMPLELYLPLHGEARLTDRERQLIVDWAEAQAGIGVDAPAGIGD